MREKEKKRCRPRPSQTARRKTATLSRQRRSRREASPPSRLAPTKEETRELGDTEERKEILKDFGYLEARVPGRLTVAFSKLPGQLLRTLHTVKKFENSTEPGDRTEALLPNKQTDRVC